MPEEVTPPQSWASTQFTRARLLCGLTSGDRARNLREALTCYENALQDWTEADSPLEWASAQECRGMAYWDLYMAESGDRLESLHAAVDCYRAALRVRTEAADPREWAMTQNTLGLAYSALTFEQYELLGHDPRDSPWYQPTVEAYAAAERGYLAAGMKKDAARMRPYQSYDRPPPTVLGRLKRWLTRGV